MATIDDIRAKFKGAGFDAHVATKLAEAFALVLASSGALTVKEGGTTASSAVTALDFGAGFGITESPSGEANVSLDMSEAQYDNSTSGLTATDVQAAIDELASSNGGWTFIHCDTEESRASTTTITDDPALTVPIAANEELIIRGEVVWKSASVTPDLKFTVNGPASPTEVTVWAVGAASEGTTATQNAKYSSFGNTVTAVIAAANANTIYRFTVIVRNGANAGNVAIGWAQNVSDSTPVIRCIGSWLEYRKP